MAAPVGVFLPSGESAPPPRQRRPAQRQQRHRQRHTGQQPHIGTARVRQSAAARGGQARFPARVTAAAAGRRGRWGSGGRCRRGRGGGRWSRRRAGRDANQRRRGRPGCGSRTWPRPFPSPRPTASTYSPFVSRPASPRRARKSGGTVRADRIQIRRCADDLHRDRRDAADEDLAWSATGDDGSALQLERQALREEPVHGGGRSGSRMWQSYRFESRAGAPQSRCRPARARSPRSQPPQPRQPQRRTTTSPTATPRAAHPVA